MDKKLTELTEKYAQASIIHQQALKEGDSEIANKQYDVQQNIYERLMEIGKPGQDVLLDLINHPDAAVRCSAAADSLSYNEKKAKEALKALQEHDQGFAGFRAKWALRWWEKKKRT